MGSFEILQVALTSGGAIATLAAAIRSWAATRKNQKKLVKIQVGEKEWTIDASKMSREELDKILGELAKEIEPEAPGAQHQSGELPGPSGSS